MPAKICSICGEPNNCDHMPIFKADKDDFFKELNNTDERIRYISVTDSVFDMVAKSLWQGYQEAGGRLNYDMFLWRHMEKILAEAYIIKMQQQKEQFERLVEAESKRPRVFEISGVKLHDIQIKQKETP